MGRYPGRIRDIIACYRVKDCRINVKLFRVVLNLCRQARIADEGIWVLRKMDDFRCRRDSTMYNVVIELFYEKGDIDTPMELMREMESCNLCRNRITFMSMLKVICYVGRLEDAFQLVKTVKRYGCAPNMLAYSALFNGLCRVGSFEKVLELLGEMEKVKSFKEAHKLFMWMLDSYVRPDGLARYFLMNDMCLKGKFVDALTLYEDLEKKGFVVTIDSDIISALLVELCQQNRVVEVANWRV